MKKRMLIIVTLVLSFLMFLNFTTINKTFAIYRENLNTKVYLNIINEDDAITIEFDSRGGTPVDSYKRELNEEIGTLPETTKEGENFIGWYTQADGGTKVNPYDLVTGSVKYYAHWTKIICKKAEDDTRHKETCASSGSCVKSEFGYSSGNKITYGTLAGPTIPVTGNAYDCDVNNDEVFDPESERFYYVRTILGDDERAVLVYYTSFDNAGAMDSSTSRGSYIYSEAITYLPNGTLWTNPGLKSFDVSLTDEPLIKTARLINTTDLYEACGSANSLTGVSFVTCQYILENTRFQSKSLGRAGIWIERINNNGSYTYYRIQTQTPNVASVEDSSLNAARPVIEIPFSAVEGFKEKSSFNVTFNSLGGTAVASTTRYDGQAIGQLPTTVKSGFTFDGWYTDLEDETTKATANTVIESNTTFYAKWIAAIDILDYVFYIPGSCTFNGSEINITSNNNNCISIVNSTNNNINYATSSNNYIDTGISLYSENNKGKDYEIGFTINSYVSTNNIRQATLMNTKLEGNNYPGLVFRKKDDENDKLDLSSKRTIDENERVNINYSQDQTIKIYRIRNTDTDIQEIYYSINDGNKILVNDLSEYNPIFDLNVWFGAAPENTSATSAQRYFIGTLSNLYIRLERDGITKETVTFNAHEGVADYAEKEVNKGASIGSLPNATKSGFVFDGWYTQEIGGEKVTESTIITDSIELHAHWKNIYLVTFEGNGGTVSISPNTLEVVQGETIGTENIPTAYMANKQFDGWYTSNNVKIDGTETINIDTTYYAHYKDIFTVTFDADGGELSINPNTISVVDGESIGINNLPTATKEDLVFEGWYTSNNVRINGTEIITSNVIYTARYIEISHTTVYFNANNGTAEYTEKDVIVGLAIGSLPTATRDKYDFGGWYTDNTFTSQIDSTTTVSGTTTYIARWIPRDFIARIGDVGYETLALAALDASTTETTTIVLLANTDEKVTVNEGRKVLLDLNGKIVKCTNSTLMQVFLVNGIGSYLELINGTVTSGLGSGMINVESNGILKVGTNATLSATGTRQAIYNDGGTVYILPGSTISAKTNQRSAVHNKNNGTVYITGGTITSTGAYAIYNENGTVIIGEKDGTVNVSSPIIQGETYGIVANKTYKFYDGTIKGKTAAVGTATTGNTPTVAIDTNETKISEIEVNTEKARATVDDYKVLYLQTISTNYMITLDLRGGSVGNNVSTLIMVEPGEKVGTLPTPTKGIYTFDGWYDEETNEEVDENTIPTKSTTYYANWVYVANPNVVEFDPTPDVQKVYYQNINTWKLSSTNFPTWSSDNKSPTWALDATENTPMKNNFDNYNCKCTDDQCSSAGTVNCDKPKGYNTGVQGQLNVYVYNTSENPKGTQVTYAKATNGIIYNLIPNQVYYWELNSDPNVHGLVKFTGQRRLIDAGDVLNVRDLGGLPVDTDGNGTIDGHLKYGRLIRGIKLNSSSSVTELNNLGITKELDLREANSDQYRLSNYERIEAQNYYVKHNSSANIEQQYYTMTRAAVKQAMLDITNSNNPQNIYFHCRIGTDRTGTVAYILEGLLGVPEEDRIRDYELSFFYGLIRIHRYHNEKPGSSVGTGKERFTYMHDFMPTNDKIYEWYMAGTTEAERQNDINLINAFRQAMIE